MPEPSDIELFHKYIALAQYHLERASIRAGIVGDPPTVAESPEKLLADLLSLMPEDEKPYKWVLKLLVRHAHAIGYPGRRTVAQWLGSGVDVARRAEDHIKMEDQCRADQRKSA